MSPGRKWLAFVLVSLAYILALFHRAALAVVSPDLVRAFEMSPVELGLLGSAYFYPYAFMQVVSGISADALGPRMLLVSALVVGGGGSIWFGLSPSLWQAVAARAAVGLGVAFVYVPALKLLGAWFGEGGFGGITGTLLSIGSLGYVLAAAPLALVASAVGWRASFVGVGVFSLGFAMLLFVVLGGSDRADRGRRKRQSAATAPGDGRGARASILALGVWFAVFSGTRLSFQGVWGGPYLGMMYGGNSTAVGVALLALVLGGTAGTALWGFACDRLGRSLPLLLAGSVADAALWIGQALLRTPLPLWGACVLYFLLGLTGGVFGTLFVLVKRLASPGKEGATLGVVNSFPFMGSAVLTQVFGWVVERVSPGQASLGGFRLGFAFYAAATVLASLPLFGLKEKRRGADRALKPPLFSTSPT